MSRGAQIPGATSHGRINYVWWRLIFLEYSVCNLLHVPLLGTEILRWILDFGKILCSPAHVDRLLGRAGDRLSLVFIFMQN
jgi:hypothetical protein